MKVSEDWTMALVVETALGLSLRDALESIG